MLPPPASSSRYPFTACEVFCCEVDAIFSTLLEDEALLGLLFSLLDAEPPLSCKTAGYFARVVGQLLLRKPNEMMQYLSNHDGLLENLVRHLDVTSIADVLKRLAGADEQAAMLFLPMHTQWLVETPLLEMLLQRLGPGWSSDTVTNAADVLTAIAHTQPSALAAQLMAPASVAELFKRALEPGGGAIVPALEVCSALLRPRRGPEAGGPYYSASPPGSSGGFAGGGGGSSGGGSDDSGGGGSPAAAAAQQRCRLDALGAMLSYLPQLTAFLRAPPAPGAMQATPYGLLSPPLGRARLKVVELLAVLLAVCGEGADGAIMAAGAMRLALDLFAAYPFNNLLHHQVYAMLAGTLQRASPAMVEHTLGACRLAEWLAGLPSEVTPLPRPGAPPPKGPLPAGYSGHVTAIGNLLAAAAAQKPVVADALSGDEAWAAFAGGELQRRNEVEDVSHWECGRPASAEMEGLGSDGDDYPVRAGKGGGGAAAAGAQLRLLHDLRRGGRA
jgi:serine/threonine-protein phosphatase 6 regulatory subunit 3